MVQVTLKEEVVKQLSYVADQWDTDLSGAIAQLVRNQLGEESKVAGLDQAEPDQFDAALAQIEKEHDTFISQHAELLQQYRGQYVAMRDGQIVDNDRDQDALYRRILSNYGDEPVLITSVDTEPIATYYIRSPKLPRNGA